MQISKRQSGAIVDLLVEGRMDVHWSEHLATAVREEMRQGSHHVRLDLSRVPYLSSAGIGVLVRLHQEFQRIQGSFRVTNCSPTAQKSLEITNLAHLLVAKEGEGPAGSATEQPAKERQEPERAKRIERDAAVYEVFPLRPEAKLTCRTIGDIGRLADGGWSETDCRAVKFSAGTFAIGLGALGECFEDCRERFGEFIAAGGAVAYLPTDGTNAPDFLLAGGATLPEAQVCYAVACEGAEAQPFSHLIRFEAAGGARAIALSSLLATCLALAETREAGLVMIAESAGLVGAALRRSPAVAGAAGDAFSFPGIREWLSFTAEPAHTKSSVLLAGVALAGPCGGELSDWVRPLCAATPETPSVSGHLHAAAFSYRPVPKGNIELKQSVGALFEGQTLEGILHLLSDDRSEAGRESELVRGACWIAPVAEIAGRKARG